MSRKFLDTVRSDISAQLQTNANTTGLELNAVLQDLIDSSVQDESAIAGTTPVLSFVTSTAWTEIDEGYTVDVGGDAEFLFPNFASGQIQTSNTAGFTYNIRAQISIADLGNNVPVEFTLLANGVPTGFIATTAGRGNNRPLTVSFSGIKLSGVANEVWSVGVATPNAADTIDIFSISMSVTILPTNNP